MITYYLLFVDALGETVESISLDAKTETEANIEHLDVLLAGIGDGVDYMFTAIGTEDKYEGEKPSWSEEDLAEILAAAHAADLEEDLDDLEEALALN